MEKKEPIVVFGIPRSGSTWFAQVLASNGQYKYLHEPDNEKVNIMGYMAKNELPRFPYLSRNKFNSDYINLFKSAISGKIIFNDSVTNKTLMKLFGVSPNSVEHELSSSKKTVSNFKKRLVKISNSLFGYTGNRIVKTVHGIMALPALLESVSFKPILILRHPAAVVLSMLNLNMPDANRHIYEIDKVKKEFNLTAIQVDEMSDLELMGLQIGIFYSFMDKLIDNDGISFYMFEEVCVDVERQFKQIFSDLNLEWNDKVIDFIQLNNKPGSGYNTQRVAAEQADKWKNQLNSNEIAQIERGYKLLKPKFYNESWD